MMSGPAVNGSNERHPWTSRQGRCRPRGCWELRETGEDQPLSKRKVPGTALNAGECRSSIHRAHAEVEVAEAVAVGVGDGERQVEAERDGAHLGDQHADAGADRGPELVEIVVPLDRAEVGEDDLLDGVAGREGELV